MDETSIHHQDGIDAIIQQGYPTIHGACACSRKVDIVRGEGYDDLPRFELVSLYAERLKLALESAEAGASTVRVCNGAVSFRPTLLLPTTTNHPMFDCFYFHTDARIFSRQMTIATVHDLSGAYNAKTYIDQLLGAGNTPQCILLCSVSCRLADVEPTVVAKKFQGCR